MHGQETPPGRPPLALENCCQSGLVQQWLEETRDDVLAAAAQSLWLNVELLAATPAMVVLGSGLFGLQTASFCNGRNDVVIRWLN